MKLDKNIFVNVLLDDTLLETLNVMFFDTLYLIVLLIKAYFVLTLGVEYEYVSDFSYEAILFLYSDNNVKNNYENNIIVVVATNKTEGLTENFLFVPNSIAFDENFTLILLNLDINNVNETRKNGIDDNNLP